MKAAGRLVGIVLNLKVHVMRSDMNFLLVKDLILVEEVMTEIRDIFPMIEVLDITQKIQDLEVTKNPLSALRLSIIGFEMSHLQVADKLAAVTLQMEMRGLGAGLLTVKQSRIAPTPWGHVQKQLMARILKVLLTVRCVDIIVVMCLKF